MIFEWFQGVIVNVMLVGDFGDCGEGFGDLLGGSAVSPHFSMSFEPSAFHSLTLHQFHALESYVHISIHYTTFIHIPFV